MFISPKPLAALSSGLLARKGSARPAMRPQAYATLSSVTPVDDLGWNDMGGEPDVTEPELPPVLVERAALKDEVEQAPPTPDVESIAVEPVAVAPVVDAELVAVASVPNTRASVAAVLPQPRASARGKAAFTLRLDGPRHLRLRLASAVTHRSSQALLTGALDAFLQTLPEVEELATQCSPPTPMGDPR